MFVLCCTQNLLINSQLAKQEAALKADYSAYIKDLKAQEKLETKETKLIKKLASEGTKLDAKQLQKLKEIEGELSAAKALTSAQKSKVALDEGAVEKVKTDDRRANSKLAALKANEKEAKEAIEEVEILKAEEAEIISTGGGLDKVDAGSALSKGIGQK